MLGRREMTQNNILARARLFIQFGKLYIELTLEEFFCIHIIFKSIIKNKFE